MTSERFAGTSQLIRLGLRRDRVRIPLWVLGIVAALYLTGSRMPGLYETQAQIDGYARLVGSSPATVAIAGPPVGLHTIAGIVMYETYLTVIAAVSIMAVLMISRHTRAEEESGRTELLRATESGRYAAPAAAMVVTGGTCLAVGVSMAVVMPATSLSATDSLLYGAGMAGLGLVMAAITLCFAQVFTHARACTGAGLAAFLGFYLVRAVGDVRGDWLVWLSPVGWAQATGIPAEHRAWPLLLPLAATAVLGWLAVRLADRRDFGVGLVPARPGSARATWSLRGPASLSWHLQRGAFTAWLVAMAGTAALIGTLGTSMEDLIRDNPEISAYLALTEGGSVIEAYQGTFALIMSLAIASFGVWSMTRAVPEESANRLELLLAGPLPRTRSLLADLLVGVVGVVALSAVAGAAAALSFVAVTGEWAQGTRFAVAPLVHLPAILVLVGVVVATYGWLPRWTWIGWLVLTFEIVIGWLGGLLRPPAWVIELSLFDRSPRYPLEPFAWEPLLALSAAAVALLTLGWWGFRRRDIG